MKGVTNSKLNSCQVPGLLMSYAAQGMPEFQPPPWHPSLRSKLASVPERITIRLGEPVCGEQPNDLPWIFQTAAPWPAVAWPLVFCLPVSRSQPKGKPYCRDTELPTIDFSHRFPFIDVQRYWQGQRPLLHRDRQQTRSVAPFDLTESVLIQAQAIQFEQGRAGILQRHARA